MGTRGTGPFPSCAVCLSQYKPSLCGAQRTSKAGYWTVGATEVIAYMVENRRIEREDEVEDGEGESLSDIPGLRRIFLIAHSVQNTRTAVAVAGLYASLQSHYIEEPAGPSSETDHRFTTTENESEGSLRKGNADIAELHEPEDIKFVRGRR